jgi:deazaflavin-dependent oxidoreductase (nitroreductase family)
MPRSQQPMNKEVVQTFRANNGQMVTGPYKGVQLLLLHTKGAKSGEERVNPVGCIYEDNRLFVVASNNGATFHPGWYFNVQAHPEVTVELGTETFKAEARTLQDEERDAYFHKIVARFPVFFKYRETAQPRVIPIVELVRINQSK